MTRVRIGKYGLTLFWILISIALIGLGIYQYLGEKARYRDYKQVDGFYEEKTLYSTEDGNNTYSLTYSYYVDGKAYTVSTNYGTQSIPKKGSIRKIVYNPYNPSDSFIKSISVSDTLFFCGFGSLTIFFLKIMNIFSSYIKRKKLIDLVYGFLIGYLFCSIAIYIYAIITGTKNIFTIFDMFSSYGIVVLFPIFFFLVGIFILIYHILPQTKEKNKNVLVIEKDQKGLNSIETFNKIKKVIKSVSEKADSISIIVQLIVSFLILGLLFYLAIHSVDLVTVLAVLPFLLFTFFLFIKSFVVMKRMCFEHDITEDMVAKRKKLDSRLEKMQTMCFLLFWFGLLLFVSIMTIINGSWIIILFTIPFWVVGINIVKSTFQKK